VIHKVNEKFDPVVFIQWSRPWTEENRADRYHAAHDCQTFPSLAALARNGFFGSEPFSQINTALRAAGKPEIDWQLPN
jgi:uracil-DNA glycosylase